MDWSKAKNIEENKYDLPGNWLHIHYFEALNILFRIENSLRVFVYIILKNEFKEKWKDLSLSSDDDEKSTISSIAKKRFAQDSDYSYLGYLINSPLLHLTSGELIRIITSDSYWKFFKNYFLGSKEITRTKLDEIGNIRNSLAHFRPIKEGDVDLIKQNSLHTLVKIENFLGDFITCRTILPTNTEANWYKEIKVLNSKECDILFNQTKDENWVDIKIVFNPPKLEVTKFYSSYYFKTFKLKTDAIIKSHLQLTKYLICASESVSYNYHQDIDKVTVSKVVHLKFGKKTLESCYLEILEELKVLFKKISNEIELIVQDELARGNFVELVNLRFSKEDSSKYFTTTDNKLLTDSDVEQVTEYWGSINSSRENYISNTTIYPWINIEISEDKTELPF